MLRVTRPLYKGYKVSTVKIELHQWKNGLTKVSVDGKYCGSLEDLGSTDTSIPELLRNIIKHAHLDNMEVIEK